MDRMRKLRGYIREVLREAFEGADLPHGAAVYVIEDAKVVDIIVYNTELFQNILDKKAVELGLPEAAAMAAGTPGVVFAYIQIRPPWNDYGTCNGAWYVSMSAGRGYGKMLYGLAYAATPNGLLMPDRDSVSDDAFKGWTKASRSRRGISFDDVNNPKTPDPGDDCRLHKKGGDGDCGGRNPEVLNSAYPSQGWEKGVLEAGKAAHEAFMENLIEFGCDTEAVERSLKESSRVLFRTSLRGNGYDDD